MTDTAGLQETCEAIRAILSDTETDQARVIDLAGRYSSFAHLANTRIRRACEWLAQGSRAEAIHHVEIAPNVMEIATTLELGFEKTRWQQLCSDCGIRDIELVSADLARELNSAYVKHRELETQLSKYRLLCLAGSPVTERIKALAPLAKVDPENHYWKEQIGALERARLLEVRQEASAALERGELGKLQELLAEISKAGWLAEPPAPLRRALQDHVRQLKLRQDASRLSGAALKMQEALAAMDREGVRTGIRDWEAVVASGQVRATDDEGSVLEQAKAWLASQDANREKQESSERMMATLEKAIDDREPYAEIERIHDRLMQAGASLNPILARRFSIYVSEAKLERKSRNRAMTTGVVGVLLIAGVGLAWMVLARTQKQRVDSYLGVLDRTIKTEDIRQARTMLAEAKSLDETVAKHPEVQAGHTKLTQLIEQADDKAKRFASRMETIEARSGTDAAVWHLLDEARTLAGSESETARVRKEEGRLRAEKQAAQDSVDKPFDAKREALYAGFRALDRRAPAYRDQLGAILAQFGELFRSSQGVSEGSIKLATDARSLVQGELDKLLEGDRRTRLLNEQLAKIPERSANVTELLSRLRSFRDKFPDAAQARQVDLVLRSEKDLENLEAVASGIASWKKNLSVANSDEAHARLRLLENASGILQREAVSRYTEYLTAMSSGKEASEARVAALRDQQNTPWRRRLKWINDEAGERYYTFDGTVTPSGQGFLQVNHLLTSIANLAQDDFKATKTKLFKPDRMKNLEAVFAELVGRTKTELALLDEHKISAEQFHLRIAKATIEQERIDPIPRLAALQQDLLAYSQVAWPKSPAVEEFLIDIKGLSALDPEVDWIASEGSAAARNVAANALKKCPDLGEVESASSEAMNALHRSLTPPLLAGIVWKDTQDDAVTIRAWRQGTGLVLRRERDMLTLEPVAEIDANGTRWLQQQRPPLGTPVFIRQN